MGKPIVFCFIFIFPVAMQLPAQTIPTYEWYLSEHNGGLCGHSLVLYSDSTYCSESGCEGSSRFSFGKWSQKKNIVTFAPANRADVNFIKKVERAVTNDNRITVTLFDRNGINITNRIIIGQYIAGKGMYKMDLDSTNQKRTDLKRDGAVVILTTLQRFTKQRLAVDIDSSNHFKIYLTIPSYWNFHNNSTWEGDETFSLSRARGKLVSLMPDRFDGDRMVYSEYIKQNE